MPTAARSRKREQTGLGPDERKYWLKKAGWKTQTALAAALRKEGRDCADTTLSAILDQRTQSDPLERRLTEIVAKAMREADQSPALSPGVPMVDYVFPERLDR